MYVHAVENPAKQQFRYLDLIAVDLLRNFAAIENALVAEVACRAQDLDAVQQRCACGVTFLVRADCDPVCA